MKARYLIATALVAMLAAAGCSSSKSGGGSQTASGGSKTLTVWLMDGSAPDKLVADLDTEFQAAHAGVTVKYAKQQWNGIQEKLTTALASNNPPDVIELGNTQTAKFASSGALADLSGKVSDLGGQNWLKALTESGAWQGKQFGVPFYAANRVVIYRTDLFKKAGLPTDRAEVAKLWSTWADYVNTGKTYMAKAPAGSSFMDTASGMFNAMVGASPNQYYDQSGNTIYDTNPAVKDAWNLAMQAIAGKETAKLKQFDTAWNQAFSTGAFATIAAPSWMIGYIQGQAGAKGAGKWDVTTGPGGTGNWGGSYLAVPTASKHIPQAVDLAKWLTAPAQQVKLFLKQGSFPSSTTAIADPQVVSATNKYFNNAPIGQIFGDSAKNLPVAILGPKDGVIKDTFSTAIQRVEQQGMSPDASYSKFLADIKNALDS